MADFNQCLISYGVEVTATNRSIDFRAVSGGAQIFATLQVGLYSISSLALEVSRAMRTADPARTYTVTVLRSTGGQARIKIQSSGTFLTLLFQTGDRASTSAATILGFSAIDRAGSTNYTGTANPGLSIVPQYPPYNYMPPDSIIDAKRSENETTSGQIETVSFATFRNFEFKCRYFLEGSTEFLQFASLNRWLLRGGPIEFTANVNAPSVFYVGIPLNLRPPMRMMRVEGMYDYFETPLYSFRELT